MSDLINVTKIDDEPYVLDTDLAEALGMARLRDIRANVIEPNRAELEGFGSLRSVDANPGRLGGRPGKAFYLNEEQALLVAVFSRTERAKEVRAALVRVFAAYRRGDLGPASVVPQLPNFANPAEAARAWAAEYEQRQITEQRLAEAVPKVEFYNNYADASGLTNTRTLAKTIGRKERELVSELLAHHVLHRSKGGSVCNDNFDVRRTSITLSCRNWIGQS
ncbi:hypothetical protein E6C67_21175 [Azospirillum sp. TSA2s]|uniref:phage antirepressor KilAC domain-containing protein n=1 Tax=Azospirillum sp. TSA2s TaxID=709810 RepID=UPI0010AAF7E2|nr:phage antirepressor KilAC domain-containing protein [Azospirillum sp. TSA2s]QCG96325.1 hypothetical protein E6C67_21175 [Azospirillum sp. TSA2s]